jgi:tetratricopeptide (TPR) repeat protein
MSLPVLAATAIAVLGGFFLLWLICAPGPRRARKFRRSQRLLRQGNWQHALEMLQALHNSRLSKVWHDRLRNAEGECHRVAGVQAVQAKDFETGLSHHLLAAEIIGINATSVRASVVEKMLAEVRTLFASTKGTDTAAVQTMIERVLCVASGGRESAGSDRRTHVRRSPCPEASFWQGLCHIREDQWEQAREALQNARDAEVSENAESLPLTTHHSPHIDLPLYLSGVLLRLGRPKEALRFVTEANRIDGNCPLVALQLGIAMVEAGADGNLATRALNRAIGSRGLGKYFNDPEHLWIDGFPENRSFIRKLGDTHPFVCPLWGNDLRLMVRRGELSLGQAHYCIGQFKAAADVFQKMFNEAAPTHEVLRWLGLALTRLELYHDAFPHLKTALEMEDPQDRLTAGYLALCAACAKPDRPQDKEPNIEWAVRTVRRFEGFGDREWVIILKGVFAEAAMLSTSDDLVFFCDHLLSVQATDPEAAAAYHRVAVEYPSLLKPPYAWLYCRAAMLHNLDHDRSLDLFALTISTANDARTYFASQEWDFDELEYAFLQLAALKEPGSFPTVLGPDYPAKGEAMLLERSVRFEKDSKHDAALASAEVLLRLSPRSPRAHDRLAMLCYRGGNVDRAVEILNDWCAVEPTNPVPLARLAVIYQRQGRADASSQAMHAAIERADDKKRPDLHYLAARLLLANRIAAQNGDSADVAPIGGVAEPAQSHLRQCLNGQPDHTPALWLSAAIHTVRNDRSAIQALSPSLEGNDCTDGRFHYFAAVSHLAAGKYAMADAAAIKASQETTLEVEATYLRGWASIHGHDHSGAIDAMSQVARASDSPSRDHARGILGSLRFHEGATDDAIGSWQNLSTHQRTAWHLDEPLQKCLFLRGLQAIHDGRFEQAAESLREAAKAGLREQSLTRLIQFAVVKAGQRHLYAPAAAETAAEFFEQAMQEGASDSEIPYMLALARKRQGKLAAARMTFQKIANPDSTVFLQMGILSFKENQLAQAAQEFERAWQLEPASYAAGYNLMQARLCQGNVDACVPVVKRLQTLAPDADQRRFFAILEPLLQRSGETANGKPPPLPSSVAEDIVDEELDEKHLESNGIHDLLAALSPADEQRLLPLLLGINQTRTGLSLLRVLAHARPKSQPVQEAFATAVLLQAKQLVERCHWEATDHLLVPVAASFTGGNPACRHVSSYVQAAAYNVLGCCQCMLQEYDRAIDYFSWAIKLLPSDPWLHQNLALAFELQGQIDQADTNWNRYFELQTRVPAPNIARYHENLAYEGLNRLADVFSKKERWNTALTYLQRACRIRPGDFETLERLYHMYNQVKRPEDARRTLTRLRELRPNDPQMELYELDLREVKTLEDIERMLADIRKALTKFNNDLRVEEKAVAMVANIIPLLRRMSDQYTNQLGRVMDQVRRLPNYQINWPTVHDVMGDLQREFQKLRRLAKKCLNLVASEEHRRVIRDLVEHIEQKIETCQSMGA